MTIDLISLLPKNSLLHGSCQVLAREKSVERQGTRRCKWKTKGFPRQTGKRAHNTQHIYTTDINLWTSFCLSTWSRQWRILWLTRKNDNGDKEERKDADGWKSWQRMTMTQEEYAVELSSGGWIVIMKRDGDEDGESEWDAGRWVDDALFVLSGFLWCRFTLWCSCVRSRL